MLVFFLLLPVFSSEGSASFLMWAEPEKLAPNLEDFDSTLKLLELGQQIICLDYGSIDRGCKLARQLTITDNQLSGLMI